MPMFSAANTGDAVVAALVAALAAYLTADLVVFPRYGNLPAVAADTLISALVLMEISVMGETPISWPGLGLLAVLVAAGEWYYHGYLSRLFSARRGKKRN